MDNFTLTLIAAALAILWYLIVRRKKKPAPLPPFPETYRHLLETEVPFYTRLDAGGRAQFEQRMQRFLWDVRITGINTEVTDLDRVLIGAGAIIPIFGFPGWEYRHLNEVLLYPDSFDEDFSQEGSGRNILGLVGNGPFERVMILSRHELRQGFLNKTGKNNTVIHEFVHLIDKSDGSIDGIPEHFTDKQTAIPWIQLMQKEINKIMRNQSDIDPYGATNQAEFFAVVSEYFFERPDLLQQKHPQLYAAMAKIFRQGKQ